MKIADLYQHVTNSIISDLEKGVASWVKPWKTGNGGGVMPMNAVTKRAYSGVNIPILWHAGVARGYPTQQWMTYKQALPLDAHVRKGEHGTTVVFTKKLIYRESDSDEERRISMLRTYTVFNVAQIDGLPTDPSPVSESKSGQDAAMLFIDATTVDIRIGGDRACHVPSHDFVALPPEQAFTSREHYLATALHELGHWSGHKSRLDRDVQGRFGTMQYAAEELVAELTASFLCAHLGIKGELRHSEYIASWLELLRDDNRAIFTASSKASQAADYLRSFSEQVGGDKEKCRRGRRPAKLQCREVADRRSTRFAARRQAESSGGALSGCRQHYHLDTARSAPRPFRCGHPGRDGASGGTGRDRRRGTIGRTSLKVLFLSDGTATIDLRDTAGGTIPADQVQRLTLATLGLAFAEVLSVAEACEKLPATRTRATA